MRGHRMTTWLPQLSLTCSFIRLWPVLGHFVSLFCWETKPESGKFLQDIYFYYRRYLVVTLSWGIISLLFVTVFFIMAHSSVLGQRNVFTFSFLHLCTWSCCFYCQTVNSRMGGAYRLCAIPMNIECGHNIFKMMLCLSPVLSLSE